MVALGLINFIPAVKFDQRYITQYLRSCHGSGHILLAGTAREHSASIAAEVLISETKTGNLH